MPVSLIRPTSVLSSSILMDKICPRVPFGVWYNEAAPEQRVFAGCKAWQCLVCGPKKASDISKAVAWSAGQDDWTRLFTLTQVPLEWPRARQKMADLSRWNKGRGNAWQVAWTIEHNPEGTGHHIHCVQYGDYIPWQDLKKRWGKIVDLRAVKGDNRAAARYIGNANGSAARYIANQNKEDWAGWLDINGGHGMHWTRDYFRGLTIREAVKAAKVAEGRKAGTVWIQLTDPDELWRLFHKTRSRPTSDPIV